jgi:hypothetical protein
MSHCIGVAGKVVTSLLSVWVVADGEIEHRSLGVSGTGDFERVESLDVDGPESSDDGTSDKKLHVSPFLSQLAHIGCLQSHCPYVSLQCINLEHVV